MATPPGDGSASFRNQRIPGIPNHEPGDTYNGGFHHPKQGPDRPIHMIPPTQTQQKSAGRREKGKRPTPLDGEQGAIMASALLGRPHKKAKHALRVTGEVNTRALQARKDTYEAQGGKPIGDIDGWNKVFERFAEAFQDFSVA